MIICYICAEMVASALSVCWLLILVALFLASDPNNAALLRIAVGYASCGFSGSSAFLTRCIAVRATLFSAGSLIVIFVGLEALRLSPVADVGNVRPGLIMLAVLLLLAGAWTSWLVYHYVSSDVSSRSLGAQAILLPVPSQVGGDLVNI